MGICWPAPLSRFQTYVHMCRFAVFAFSVFALAIFPCDGNELKKQWLAHLRRVSATGFPCGEPQNRTVDVRELVDDDAWQEMKFFEVMPLKTVLQRCFSAGSCANAFACKPDVVEERHLIFALKGHNNQLTFRNISVEDHISCRCQLEEDIPK